MLACEAAHGEADDRIVARLLGRVIRQRRLLLRIEVTPVLEWDGRLGRLCLFHAQPMRRPFIQVERAAWGMDDHHAVAPGGADDLVHYWRHAADALSRELAVMI